jgi:enoyl-CoA hydratase/carnithine racemase
MSSACQASDAPLLTRTDAGGLTTITLNRPSEFNVLSTAMLSALQHCLDTIADDKSVRVVVIAGAGKAFCAGHDLKEMRSDPSMEFQQALFRQCSRLMLKVTQMPQPVIARVQGVAAAAGCQLVSICDLAVAADVAKFAVSGVKFGLFCSSPAVGIARNIGRKQALEMLFTGDVIDAVEAQRRGLVNRVVPLDALDAEVGELAGSLLAKTPVALAMDKQLFYKQLDMGLEAALQYAAEVMACNMMTEDAQHGIDCFIEKKTPEWKGQ